MQLEEYRLGEIERERKTLLPKSYRMSQEEERRAGEFLTSQDLVKNTMKAIEKTGLVGEEQNGLLLFFLYLSRLFDEPLHAIIYGKIGQRKNLPADQDQRVPPSGISQDNNQPHGKHALLLRERLLET